MPPITIQTTTLFNKNPLLHFSEILVKEDCSARKAAKRLVLEPATVTKQIGSLEEVLGIKLFERTRNHRLLITPEGQDFYDMAIIQMQGIDSLFGNFHEAQKEKKKNKLVIAVHQAVGAYIIPKYLKELLEHEEFKDTQIKLCNIPRNEAFKRLMDKTVDFTFYSSTYEEDTLVEIEKEEIFKYKSALILHKKHPLAKKSKIDKNDIQEYKFLIRDGSSLYSIKKSLNLDASNIEFENGTIEMTIGLVAENIDMTGVANTIVNNHSVKLNDDIIYKDTTHLFPDSTYSLFYQKNTIHKNSATFLLNRILEDQESEYK